MQEIINKIIMRLINSELHRTEKPNRKIVKNKSKKIKVNNKLSKKRNRLLLFIITLVFLTGVYFMV